MVPSGPSPLSLLTLSPAQPQAESRDKPLLWVLGAFAQTGWKMRCRGACVAGDERQEGQATGGKDKKLLNIR